MKVWNAIKHYGWVVLVFLAVFSMLMKYGPKPEELIGPCEPCFKYFEYIDHDQNQLVLKNGPREIMILSTNTGFPEDPHVRSEELVVFRDALLTDGTGFAVTYQVLASGIEEFDSATLH